MFKYCLFFSIVFLSCTSTNPTFIKQEAKHNDTVFLQSLLDSDDNQIIIPKTNRTLYTEPLILTAQNKKIVFEDGCRIEALPGAFQDNGDKLLQIIDSENLVITGYGATIYMPKRDYQKKPYKKGEWRHSIAMYRSKNISIQGLHLDGSGGDGVYIGQSREDAVCENIVLQDLYIENQHRQGVSVIAVKDFLMENCVVINTKGTLPQAGIDFEPNAGLYGITGVVINNCLFENNSGPGILVYLKKLTSTHPPVDILIKNSISKNNFLGISMYGIPKGVKGQLELENCTINGLQWLRATKNFTVEFINNN